MDVVLQQRVPGLGLAGEVVSVKTGYARHFLIPQGMAVFATESAVNAAESMRVQAKEAEKTRLEELRSQLASVKGKTFTIVQNADENGQLYGSVSSHDVYEALQKEGFGFEESDISFAPQKHTGTYQAVIRPEPEVKETVLIAVLSEEQAKEQEEDLAKAAKAKPAKKSAQKDNSVEEEPENDKPIVLV